MNNTEQDPQVRTALVDRLIPLLARRPDQDFNVFRVMHHGTHEKQLSNLFAWLLDQRGSHKLGSRFLRVFLDAVNRGLQPDEPVAVGAFSVRQEVNTSCRGAEMDIADIVLEDDRVVIVVENYHTADGHGHNYIGYLDFGRQGGKRSIVVLLCEHENGSERVDGWENATVVTYERLVEGLLALVHDDDAYRAENPQQVFFFDHLQRYFGKGWRVEDGELLDFVEALCKTGEAGRYREKNPEEAAISFADDVREAALLRFGESREVLARINAVDPIRWTG